MKSQCKLWYSMKPMTVKLFEKFWSKVEPEEPLIDWIGSEFVSWLDDDDDRTEGMRRKFSEKPNGITRCIENKTGDIWEQTRKKKMGHGLTRMIQSSSVEIYLYQNGTVIATLTFNRHFETIRRWDPQEMITDLEPSDFIFAD